MILLFTDQNLLDATVSMLIACATLITFLLLLLAGSFIIKAISRKKEDGEDADDDSWDNNYRN